ncbi:helix-turn-helix domain-containing protein [Streptomyces xiaopingdaonensis]|uniref:helix-turn-helix domain-containing protein n=1 Tax=Streptomyces xiaopingdaonensis TaxID=1565415 RepID=UPI0003159DDE|nr:helix-turn-helix transcriptional regulator [Streptomyces xiaopingdaonensis]
MVNRKELDPENSPAAAYGARMRRMREKRGWTQEELAERLAYSSQHISAVETARKSPTLPFSRKLDRVLGVADTGESFEREWREMRKGSLLEGFSEYVSYEGRATEIRLFEIGVIPGLLQTPQYASAVAESEVARGAIAAEQGQERVAVVEARQAALVRPSPPLIFAVLDESCLRRPVGGPDVMEAQFQRLAEFAALPNTVLQVAPFDMGTRRAFDLPLYILTMPDRSLMSYAESAHRGYLDRETSFALPRLTAYHQLQAEALSQAASVAMIEQLRKGIQ